MEEEKWFFSSSSSSFFFVKSWHITACVASATAALY